MKDPIYTYIKGRGWQPQAAGYAVNNWGYFRVTVEQRDPGPEECWLENSRDFTEFVLWLRGEYNWNYTRTTIRQGRDLGELVLNQAPVARRLGFYVYTIKFERVIDDGYREA